MKNVTVICDRCGKTTHGTVTADATGGFYRKLGWEKYMRGGENLICDECMFKDPEYVKNYGKHEYKPLTELRKELAKQYETDCSSICTALINAEIMAAFKIFQEIEELTSTFPFDRLVESKEYQVLRVKYLGGNSKAWENVAIQAANLIKRQNVNAIKRESVKAVFEDLNGILGDALIDTSDEPPLEYYEVAKVKIEALEKKLLEGK